MKRLLVFPIIALAAALAFPAAALAFKGCAVGVHVGASANHSEVSILGTSDNGANTSGLIGTSLSCHTPISTSGLYAGAQVDFDFYKRMGDQPTLFGIANDAVPARRAALVGQIGYMVKDDTGVYLEAGWGWSWDKAIVIGPTSIDTPTYQGLVLGGGIEAAVFGATRLTLSYRATFMDAEATEVAPGVSLDREPRDHTVRVGFKIPFFGPAAEAPKAKALK